MNSIKINVGKSMDGYTFSIGPTIRNRIKELFPDAHPANTIFVNYDIRSGFEAHLGSLETFLYPALLGVNGKNDLYHFEEIQFVDPLTGNVLHKLNPRDEKV